MPTQLEADALRRVVGPGLASEYVEVLGFGLAGAGARTMDACRLERPERIILLGIAGTYDGSQFPVASARVFGSVSQDGIGVGQGAGHRTAEQLGFPHVPTRQDQAPLADPVPLADPGPELLSVAAASNDPAEAADRHRRHPRALGEDMEGFAVALAGFLLKIPVHIVRGASNQVGNRDIQSWKIEDALAAAWDLCQTAIPR